MDWVNMCPKCATNLSNYINELGKNSDIKYLHMMAKWRIERDKNKIKQLEHDKKRLIDIIASASYDLKQALGE